MNVVHTSRTVALALLVGSGGCGPGSVGPLPPAEPEADADLTSASTGLRVPLQARPGIVAFTDFMRLLAPPPRRAMTAQAWAGK